MAGAAACSVLEVLPEQTGPSLSEGGCNLVGKVDARQMMAQCVLGPQKMLRWGGARDPRLNQRASGLIQGFREGDRKGSSGEDLENSHVPLLPCVGIDPKDVVCAC